jgi:hypothetical protein
VVRLAALILAAAIGLTACEGGSKPAAAGPKTLDAASAQVLQATAAANAAVCVPDKPVRSNGDFSGSYGGVDWFLPPCDGDSVEPGHGVLSIAGYNSTSQAAKSFASLPGDMLLGWRIGTFTVRVSQGAEPATISQVRQAMATIPGAALAHDGTK